jgi:hypothetical protein
MGQQQAQTNNNIIPNSHYNIPNEKKIALNGHSGKSKHNSVIPVKTEFRDHFASHINRDLSSLNKGGRGNHMVHGIMGQW